MAVAKKPAPKTEEALSVDELFELPEETTPEETAEDKRIRELEAELAAVESAVARPTPESQLSPAQKRIRELEHQLAQRKGSRDGGSRFDSVPDDAIIIHFIRDGFSALGQIWYRGQELAFNPDGEAYAITKDKFGNSWVDLADDLEAQYARYGDEYFRRGRFRPRRGEVFDDEIALADQRRGLAAPISIAD